MDCTSCSWLQAKKREPKKPKHFTFKIKLNILTLTFPWAVTEHLVLVPPSAANSKCLNSWCQLLPLHKFQVLWQNLSSTHSLSQAVAGFPYSSSMFFYERAKSPFFFSSISSTTFNKNPNRQRETIFHLHQRSCNQPSTHNCSLNLHIPRAISNQANGFHLVRSALSSSLERNTANWNLVLKNKISFKRRTCKALVVP